MGDEVGSSNDFNRKYLDLRRVLLRKTDQEDWKIFTGDWRVLTQNEEAANDAKFVQHFLRPFVTEYASAHDIKRVNYMQFGNGSGQTSWRIADHSVEFTGEMQKSRSY